MIIDACGFITFKLLREQICKVNFRKRDKYVIKIFNEYECFECM